MHKIVMQQNLAAETLRRKVLTASALRPKATVTDGCQGGDHGETKVTMQGMYRWIQCTKISQVESLTTKLSQSVEDNALLEQKVVRCAANVGLIRPTVATAHTTAKEIG